MVQVSNYFKRLFLNIYFNTENSFINGNIITYELKIAV